MYDPNAERAIANIYDDTLPGRDAWSRYIDRECARLEAQAELEAQERARRESAANLAALTEYHSRWSA